MVERRRYPANLPKRQGSRKGSRASRVWRGAVNFFCGIGWFVLLCALLTMGWLTWGVRISLEPPIVREYTVESDKIENEITLVLLSDLHGCEHGEWNCELISEIDKINPDLVLMVGDMINSEDETNLDISVTAALVERLCEKYEVYYSLGNHERNRIDSHYRGAMKHIKDAGAVVLDYDYVDIEPGGNRIRLGGTYNVYVEESPADYEKSFWDEFCASDDFKLLLEHRPRTYPEELEPNGYGVDLVLSGHIHGGQVILPILGPVWGGSVGLFPEYSLGEYDVGDAKMIVSAGLSSKREIIPRVNNPTEITKIVIE